MPFTSDTVFHDLMSVLQQLIPEAILSQICPVNMDLIINTKGAMGIWIFKNVLHILLCNCYIAQLIQANESIAQLPRMDIGMDWLIEGWHHFFLQIL
jgi:hypothetical protein